MTVEELTITINQLTDSERVQLNGYAKRLIAMRKKVSTEKGHTKAELIERVQKSHSAYLNDALLDSSVVLARIREKYGISN
ncbi:hypothetical protein IJG90_04570 [Candidatus Saccharibacteria bacterium]|nr:hypothetical protein [Candidatus Saccharibacteria bacterium]